MPVFQFETALVKNLTPHTITLRSGDGDSQDIQAFAEAKINRKFLLWQPPSRAKIRILKEWVKEEIEPSPNNSAQIVAEPEAPAPVLENPETLAEENLEADTAAETA